MLPPSISSSSGTDIWPTISSDCVKNFGINLCSPAVEIIIAAGLLPEI
jgi:hypothetical protein